jgi:hypothetical protein
MEPLPILVILEALIQLVCPDHASGATQVYEPEAEHIRLGVPHEGQGALKASVRPTLGIWISEIYPGECRIKDVVGRLWDCGSELGYVLHAERRLSRHLGAVGGYGERDWWPDCILLSTNYSAGHRAAWESHCHF